MQSFELLGGKYQQGEQILPGVIQTFRSYEATTGRPVFIHRIARNDPAAQEIADLLSAGLIRSPVVRKMLLDVYETEPYRFVVTEPARQCVPLREWLEREAGEAPTPEPAPAPVHAPESPLRSLPVVEAALLPEAPPEEEAEAAAEPAPDAEFARLFQEALSGKLERSRRNTALQNAEPEMKPEQPKPIEQAPVIAAPLLPPSIPAPERDLFQVVETERAGRSRLIVILVIAVLLLLAVMVVVVFVMR